MAMDKVFLSKAKNVPLFAAFCIEYRNCHNTPNPAQYISSLPVVIDCTCNGLQHLSAMICDINIAKSVNLVDSPVIQDIYTDVCKEIMKNLNLPFKVTRQMVKKVVMTVPYNASLHSASEYFISSFVYNDDGTYSPPDELDVKVTYKELHKACSAVYNNFFKVHPTLKVVVEYFKNIADLMSSCNCPIS